MPNKRKNPITGYAVFVRETREQYQRKGIYFPKNNQDAFTFVGPLWKKLSEEEKTRYNNIAKEEKRQGASDLEAKFNAHGVSFAEIEAEKREKDEFLDIMINTIHKTVQHSHFNTTYKTQKFYLCHVNYFYVNTSERFKPAEIALSEFNLKRGVLSRFHAFIDPGPIETGYRYEAKQRLQDTHRIPIEDPDWSCGEKDYVKLFNKIKNFLRKDNPAVRIPPIYTMPDDEKNNFSLSAVRSTIETLCEASNEEPSEFRIYELPYLYHELRRKALFESPMKPDIKDATKHTLSMALHDLERDKFCFTKGISCEFHEEKDCNNFCSLSVVTRLVYTMCDFLLNYLVEEMVQGGHIPKDSILAKEVYRKDEDDDGFQIVGSLRRPTLSQMSACSSSIRAVAGPSKHEPTTSYAHQVSHASDVRASTCSYAGQSSAPPLSHQLRFVSPQKPTLTEIGGDGAGTSSLYEDADSELISPNLSQATTLSGYAASASLTQSSITSDVSVCTTKNLGRGRGILKPREAPMNWALNAGRGSRLRGSKQ